MSALTRRRAIVKEIKRRAVEIVLKSSRQIEQDISQDDIDHIEEHQETNIHLSNFDEEDPRMEDTIVSDNSISSSDNRNSSFEEGVSAIQIYNEDYGINRILPEYNILRSIMLYEVKKKLNHCALDDMVPLHPNLRTTKGDFARALNEFFEQSRTFGKDKKLLLNILYNAMGEIIKIPAVPRRIPKKDKETSNEERLFLDNARSDIEKYSSEQSRFFSFDQCAHDCTVYIGKYSQSFQCPHCNQPRYRICSKRYCKGRGGFKCAHLFNDGIPFKQLFYRPIIIVIYDLLALDKFKDYLNYRRTHCNREKYSDFLDGEIAQAHLKDMKVKGDSWLRQKIDERKDTVMVNLLLSEFYDSGQLFKSYFFDFWPLCIGILNLPPSLRGKVGISWFLAALYTGKHANAERILFNDLICEELRCLYEGIEHDVNGKKYFIQARLVVHLLDTKAAEPCMGYQSCSNSNFGCPNCGGVTGIYNGSKCIFLGNRNYLPQLHVLRFFGQTGYCCPAGFYDPKKKQQWYREEHFHHLDNGGKYETFFVEQWHVLETLIQRRRRSSRGELSLSKSTRDEVDEICHPCDGNLDTKACIEKFFIHESCQYDWFHSGEFNFENTFKVFKPFLYYRHQDYRTRRPYRRVSYAEYRKSAFEAEDLNKRSRSSKKIAVNGIQCMWYWGRLQYADLETQFTWPFVHAISGVVLKVIKLMIHGLFTSSSKSTSTTTVNKKRKSKTKSKNGKKKSKGKEAAMDNDDDEAGEEDASVNDDDTGYDDETEEDASGNDDDTGHNDETGEEDASGNDDDTGHNDETGEDDDNGIDVESESVKQTRKTFDPGFRKPYPKGKAPYEIHRKTDCLRVESWLKCVLLPKGSTDDWCVSLTSPGSMKIVQKLKMILCYWDFIFQSIPIHEAYRTLFRMFGEDMRRLLSLSIKKSEVEDLINCVIETIGTWEGMMPSHSNYFQLHEIVDLPQYFSMIGPPAVTNELPGEQMLKMIMDRKKKCNLGGSKAYLKSVMRKQIHHELWKMKSKYVRLPDEHEDPNFSTDIQTGQLIYNELPFDIKQPEALVGKEFNAFEVEFLCGTLYSEVVRRFTTTADCKISALYRIWNSDAIPKTKRSWVERLHFVIKNPDDFSANDVHVSKNMLGFKPVFYRQALIYGLKFNSRGSQCREVKAPSNYTRAYGRDTLSPTNTNTGQWYEKQNYSSWCKYHSHGYQKPFYGLLNAFFCVTAIGDQALQGLFLASVTSFDFSANRGKADQVYAQESFDNRIYFVALQDIMPTLVATIPFKTSATAITTKQIVIPKQLKKWLCSIYDDENTEPNYYVMILMHPDRLGLQPSIEDRPFTKFMS